MTDITPTAKVQTASKSEVDRSDRITELCDLDDLPEAVS